MARFEDDIGCVDLNEYISKPTKLNISFESSLINEIARNLKLNDIRALRKAKLQLQESTFQDMQPLDDEIEYDYNMRITINQIPISLTNLDNLSSFICKACDHILTEGGESNIILLRKLIFLFLGAIRCSIYPHTIYYGFERFRWDALCAETMVNIIFRSAPYGSWKRLMLEFMKESLHDNLSISPDTTIMRLHHVTQEILDAVVDSDLGTLRKLVPISKDFLSESRVTHSTVLHKYMAPSLITFEQLNGMTVFHCAASVQKVSPVSNNSSASSSLEDEEERVKIYDFLLEACCDCVMTDNNLRTPLHTAAYALNSSFIASMTSSRNKYRSKATSALEMLDSKGYRPVDALLYTMSISNWRLVLASKQLEICLLSLLPSEAVDALWTRAGNSDEKLMSESCVFYKSIVYGDILIAQAVVKLAKISVIQMYHNIILDTIVQCTKRKKERAVVLLLQEFGAELFSKSTLQHTFLNLCLSIAIWTESAALAQIFFKIYCESFPENAHEFKPSIENSSFMYFAALKGSSAVTKAFISSGVSHSLWRILTFARLFEVTGEDRPHYSVLSQYALFDNSSLVRYFQCASPLSLYCMFSTRVGTVQLLLKAMKSFCSQISDDNAIGDSSSTEMKVAFSGPIGACLLRNNHDGLKTLRLSCGTDFAKLLTQTDFFGFSCLELFLEKLKLEWVSRILQSKIRPTKRRHLICRNGNLDVVDTNISDTIETLKVVLEVLLHHLKDSGMSAFNADTFFSAQSKSRIHSMCNCSDTWMHDRHTLQDRLQESKKKLDDLYSIYWAYVVDISATGDVTSDNRCFTFEKLHQFIDIRNSNFVSTITSLYSSYQTWERLEKNIKGSYFYFNLRLLCARSFIADKNWIRIAFCLLLLIESETVTHMNTSHVNEAEVKLIWNSFIRIINNALKSAEGRSAFIFKLLAISNPYPRFGTKHCPLINLRANTKDSIWRRVENLYSNESFSIGNYGKGTSSSSLNKMTVSDVKGFVAATSSYSRRNKVNDIMNVFSSYLRTFLADCKLLDEMGHQPLPFSKPTVTSKRVLTYNDYFIICCEVDTCCKIEYLLSLTNHSGCSNERKANHSSVLDHLLCPTASIQSANGSMNKIQAYLRDFYALVRESEVSGMTAPSSSLYEQKNKVTGTPKYVNRRTFHSFKENAAADLEKPVSVLLKYNSYFGFDDELQYHLLLPLCAMGLWRSAAQVLSGINHSRSSKSNRPPSQPLSMRGPEYSAMCFLFHSKNHHVTDGDLLNSYEKHLFNHIFRSVDDVECKLFTHVGGAVNSTESWLSINLDDVAVLTPLHFAIRDRKDEFIESFFQVFDKFPINLHSLLQFATKIGAADMCSSIVRKSSAFQGSPLPLTPNYFRTFATINSFPDERHAGGVSYMRYKNLSRTVSTANYTALLFALKYSARNSIEFTYPYMVAPPQPIQHSSKVIEDSTKLLQLDGNVISVPDFLAGSYFVATTVAPCPLLGGGLMATGHTIQHDFLYESVVDSESLHMLETIFCSNSWSCRVFSLNFLGCSALYNALQSGMLVYADKMLSNACSAASTTTKSNTESLQDIDEGDTSKSSSNLTMLAIHQSLQVIPEYYSVNKITQMLRGRIDKDLREAECRCKYTTAIQNGLAGHFVYGVRPYAVESSCDTLAVLLKQVEYLWNLISESNFLRLIQLSYLKGSSELDSIVRSRQILTLLGIPFSRLGKTETSVNASPPGKVSDVPQTDDNAKENSLFTRLTPDRLRKSLPWTRCCQIKELLIGWVKNRTITKVSNIEAPIFAYKLLDISLIEASASGKDISFLMKRNDLNSVHKTDSPYDYVSSLRSTPQSMDTLRAQSNASEAFGKLCDELKFEIRPSQSSTILGSRVIATPQAIDSFIASINMDPLILKDSLRLANLICDFARLLVVSRMLVSVTTPSLPLDSTAASLQVKKVLHPLDVIDQNIFTAKERKKELEIYLDRNRIKLQSSDHLMSDGVLSMGGVNSKLQMFDILRVEDVLLFFKFPSAISERFHRFRALICDGLIALFQDLNSNDYADFICNFLRFDDTHKGSELIKETFMKTTEEPGLNNTGSVENKEGASSLSPDHSHLTSRLTSRAAQILTKTKVQRTSQAKEILTLKSGISSMLELLRNLRIVDFLSDIYAKPFHHDHDASQNVPFIALKSYSTALSSHFRMHGRHKIEIANEEAKKIVDMFCNPSAVDLNIGLSSSMARNSMKDAEDSMQSVVMNRVAAKDEMLAQLSKAYGIGNVFFDFLASIVHLSSGSLQSFLSVYNYDISCFIALAENYNPLCALCRSSSNYIRQPDREINNLPLHKRESHDLSVKTYELQVSCCEKLLKLGAIASKADNFGRVPIALAALAGNYRLLEVLLKFTATEDLKSMELFPTLLWHVLMESPCFGKDNNFETFPTITSFEECAVMLLRYEFPTEAPSMKIGKSVSKSSARQSGLDGQLTCRINDCAMSCLELAVMKRLENVVQAITNAVSDFKLTSDNSDGVDAGSVSRKLLFEHEAKSIAKSDDGDKRWKAMYLQPQCTHLSAVHMSVLCLDFDLRTIDGVYNHATLRNRVGSIEKVSILLQRHTHFDSIVSRHAEVVVQQLNEPARSSSEKELDFLHWVKKLGDVSSEVPNIHLPGDDGKVDQDMVCLRFYRNWLDSSRQLFQRHLLGSSRRQSLMGQTCPVRRAAKLYIREVKEKVVGLEKKVGDERIVLSPRKKKLQNQLDEDFAVPSSVDFVQFVLSSAGKDDVCDLFLKRLFLSPEKMKFLLCIDIDDVLLWCKNTADGEDNRAYLQDTYPKLPLSIQRLQRIVLLACFYGRCSVVDIVYSSIIRWSQVMSLLAAVDSNQISTSLHSDVSLLMSSASLLEDDTVDKQVSTSHLLSGASSSASSASASVIPASHRLLFHLLFDSKSTLELSYEDDGASVVSEVTPLQLAVGLHATKVVTHLLALTVDPCGPLSLSHPRDNIYTAVYVPISLAVEAIAKAKVAEDCCVALLKRAVEGNFSGVHGRASSTESDYDSLRSFLLCQEHRVRDIILLTGETLLHMCSRRGHLSLVSYLLEIGASPMIPDEHGNSSLQCSIGAGHGAVARALFQRCPSRIKRAVVVIAYILRKNMLRGHFRRRNPTAI